MTSKAELQRKLDASNDHAKLGWDEFIKTSGELGRSHADRLIAQKELDAYKNENAALTHSVEHFTEHRDRLVQFIEDLLVIEPQLQHALTNGVWDFERVHRAAEALRNEDALASVGYTDQCVEWPDNVTPLFPRDPEGAAA